MNKSGRPRGWNEAHVKAVIEMAAKGKTKAQTAEKLGLTFVQVRIIARQMGVRFPPGRPPISSRWQRAKELAQQGKSLSEGAAILGIHHSTAIYIGRQMGFAWPKQKRQMPNPHRRALHSSEGFEDSAKVDRLIALAFGERAA